MGFEVEVNDNTMLIKSQLHRALIGKAYEFGGELVAATKRNSRVDTGQTKNSYAYAVNESDGNVEIAVGSDYQNAIWEELGTGEYALAGNGRKGGWKYQDEKGGWHSTKGKKANRPIFRAFVTLEKSIKRELERTVKEALK